MDGLHNMIHQKIGINLTDVFIMNHLQKKHSGLFFLVPSETSTIDYSRWKFEFNVSVEMIDQCKYLIKNFNPKYIAVNLSRLGHRNLIIIDVYQEILTFFDPNNVSSDIINSEEYNKQEDIYNILSRNILSSFKQIFKKLRLGLIWRNISLAINASVNKSKNLRLQSSRTNGWCTLDAYAFLDLFIAKEYDLNIEDILLETINDIFDKLIHIPDLLHIYKTNYISMEFLKDLLPQLN